MKNKHSTRSARTTAKNIHISQGGRDLTAQAGLIPVVKLKPTIFGPTVPCSNARYSLTTRCAGWSYVVVTQYCAVGNRPPCAPILSEWQENGRVALVNKN